MAAIVKSQDNHLVSTSFLPLLGQGEVWHQTLQIQAEKFAQALLQSDQFKKQKRNQSSTGQKEKYTIQQVIVIMPLFQFLKLMTAASG
jgi:hypothetical protein